MQRKLFLHLEKKRYFVKANRMSVRTYVCVGRVSGRFVYKRRGPRSCRDQMLAKGGDQFLRM